MLRINGIKVPIGLSKEETRKVLLKKVGQLLRVPEASLKELSIVKRSLDSRRGHEPVYVFVVEVIAPGEAKILKKVKPSSGITRKEPERAMPIPMLGALLKDHPRPIVVGFGPAGMFCGLMLARAGLKPLILERGQSVEERTQTVETFWKTGILRTDSNVQFGEGGAGTFSDGKLGTLIKDKERLGISVLREMVKAGAPEEILYENKPHIGTDRLRVMVKNIREEIRSLGGEVRFETTLTSLCYTDGRITGVEVRNGDHTERIPAEGVFLGIGHSARDTFEMLSKSPVLMERKPFAMGVRVEHLQKNIDRARYHEYAAKLGTADYKVTHTASNGRGVYSFCMCPGGYVVASASEEHRLVTNGMSNYAREGRNANSALIVSVGPEDYEKYADPTVEGVDVLAGMRFQRYLEEQAYILGGGGYKAPVQRVADFHANRATNTFGSVEPTYRPGVTGANLREILPDYMSQALSEGLVGFDRQIEGFNSPDALLTGVESRTSSPVRILRDPATGMASLKGLYPMGEGAGYAGGITSAAIDGIKAARFYLDGLEHQLF